MCSMRVGLCVAVLFCCALGEIVAQDSNAVVVSGSVGMSFDSYTMTSTGITSTFARRPATVMRFSADPTISIGDWFTIPIIVSCTFREAAVIQPSFNYPDVMSFLQNPMNRISISPRYEWATLNLGSITPRYGTFTVDNAQLFGAGIDLAPGVLRASASYGILYRAVPADTSTGQSGSYERTLWAIRLGSQSEDQSVIGLTVAYMNDDQSSIPQILQSTTIPVPILDSNGLVLRDSLYSFTERNALLGKPQEGVALGMDFKSHIGESFQVSGEIAAVGFTRDKSASPLTDQLPVISEILTTRTSTSMDVAAKLDASYRDETWGINVGALYAGPGFVALSQPFFQPDRIDISVSPNVRLFDGKISASSTFGYRISDVSNMLTAGSTQILLSLNVIATLSDAFNIGGSYTNFGYRTTRAADTLRYEQVSNSISITPSYSITANELRHVFSGSFSNDAFSDVTQLNIASSANTTTAVTLLYSISPLKSSWVGRATVSIVQNNLQSSSISMKSGTVSGSYRAFDGQLEPDVALVYSLNELSGLPAESQITVRAGCRARPIESINLFANAQWTRVTSADVTTGRAYSELIGTLGFRWSF
ncbi:MAG: hypothetical protein H7X70_04840 [Candidatus Kapabacteria bacterium]|nr:hypothetical protein [Candidatus Kapabacteria bacterium]